MKSKYFARLQTSDKQIIDERCFDDLASALSWSNGYNITEDYEVQIMKAAFCILSYEHPAFYKEKQDDYSDR